ncbi:MAG: hypothetical protein HND56_10885 [Pseudomonadota bacterium]|nr:hypothetical protein [Pseudomonadota bacterium]QKK06158.1 MAG: hypothetical protein HND56_10885 [Pseudomonadota bacterium]
MHGFAVITVIFIISLLAFPKYRLHIVGGSVLIGLLLYFTTDSDIREQRTAFQRIKQAEVAVFDAVLEWNGADSSFHGRVRNSSRHHLGEVGIGIAVVACMEPEDFQAAIAALAERDVLRDTGKEANDEKSLLQTKPRVLENGVFIDTRRENRADVLKHAKIKTQSFFLGNVDLKCGLVESRVGTTVLEGGLPPGREREMVMPLSFDIPLPEKGHILWYWGVDSAVAQEAVVQRENDAKIENGTTGQTGATELPEKTDLKQISKEK